MEKKLPRWARSGSNQKRKRPNTDWLKAAGLAKGDIIVLDPISSGVCQDARADLKTPSEEPHKHAPYTPSIEENVELQEALTATRTLLNRLRVVGLVVVIAPHPRYLSALGTVLYTPHAEVESAKHAGDFDVGTAIN